MSTALPLILAIIALFSFAASAQEVAYAYSESGGRPLESGNITEYNGSDMVTSFIAGAGASLGGSGMTVEEMKREINLKLNVPNRVVDDEAGRLVLDYPGERTINQICSIYEYMVDKWSYKSDTRGIEVFQYSNQSLEKGAGRFSGQGDCDDFAILLASLVESVGGTSRIVLAYGPNSGHAYTEVYLGKAGEPESDVQRMMSWLRKKYKAEVINTHIDFKTGDVWLNLDWWKDPNTGRDLAKHPGGPFFSATSQVPIPTREGIPPQPLKPANEPPEVLFTLSPEMPVVGWNTSFNASKSRDIGGRIDAYEWNFGDGNKSGKLSQRITSHIYSKGGPYTVTLILEDDEGAANSSSRNIIVNNPPRANFTIMPPNPKVGDQVKFDASESFDAEDGRSLQYYWEINNGSAIFRAVSLPKQPFEEPGMYWINLTVTDKNGAEGHKNVLLKINQLPIPRINFSASLTLGMAISFSAAASEDPDGKIVGYYWDFGDDSEVDRNKTAQHIYDEGGEKTVRLTLEDNEGAISEISQEIFINRPPIASFSIDPAEPRIGELVSFDASASSDPDGKIERYLWDFGVGKAEHELYYSEFAEHIYSRPKEYNVTLMVEDDKGAMNYSSKQIKIDGFDEANTRHVMLDIVLGKVMGYYKEQLLLNPNQPDVVEAIRRLESGVTVINADQFERKIIGTWSLVYKGTNTLIRDNMEIKLSTDEQRIEPAKASENNNTFEDDFNDSSLSEWSLFGDPSPKIIGSEEGRSGIFDNSGDRDCDSGIVSKGSFSVLKGFSLESDILMHITDSSGCWNDAMFGLLKDNSTIGCAAPMGLLFRIRYEGDACWQTPADKRFHAYLDGGFYTDSGVWESIGAYVNGDVYVDSWHNFKVLMQEDRYVKFYIDNNLIYTSVNKIDPALLEGKKLFISGRSSGLAGKVYHDNIRLEYPISHLPQSISSEELPKKGEFIGKKILFDESHKQFWTACIDGGLEDYANELRSVGYQVDALKDGPITYDQLRGYNVLAFPNGFVSKYNTSGEIKLLSKDEIEAIKNFVYDGGGLALFECGWSWVGYSGKNIDSAPINQIGIIFGMELNDDIIHDPTNYYDKLGDGCPIFYKPFIKDHAITKNISMISNCEGSPSSLMISNPNAEILITGDDDTYSEKYAQGQKPPFLAITNYGNGKVVIFGQTGIISSTDGNHDGIKDIYEYDNKKLGLDLMAWLSSSMDEKSP